MDRFYLTYSADQPERSSEMEVALFDFLASEYSDLVDLANNTSTIQMLLTLVDARRSQQPILDFGCGPAVSLEMAAQFRIGVVGYDPSARMRRLARSRGMKVVTTTNLESKEPKFGGMIASYVLHLTVADSDLRIALNCLAPGAKFAANFHKGINVGRVEALVRATALCTQLAISDASYDHPHGEVRLWRRNHG